MADTLVGGVSANTLATAGNRRDVIAAYVEEHGGRRPIRRLLVANNGIAAVKCIRSIRRWSYETFGNEREVVLVAMATPEDVQANAEYVRMADQFVPVPGGSNDHNYANVELVVEIAERLECDAVWAGWGHASENPLLPMRLTSTGVAFLGPDASAMRALGDKVSSTLIAQSAQVPVVAWSGDHLQVHYERGRGSIDDELYRQACVFEDEAAQQQAERIGFPVMIKASEGGGGKGIRLCRSAGEVKSCFRQVVGEVPGSPVFVMRMVDHARHLEVQIVADEDGDAIALYGRDCSVQRRHQKIIEEGPVVAAPPELWGELEATAIRLAKEVGYVGAGTVEYLFDGQFYFLELNPRLQVEHPVTEWITGINLPAVQLQLAMGIPLRRIPHIVSFYGDRQPLDVQRDPRNPPHGHVIACRVTAENPEEGFQPTSGAIQELTFRNTPNVWGYFSVGPWGGVHEYADSQFGHLFAWGLDRESARRNMVLALKELSIRGDIRTTVEYLITLLEMEPYRENRIDTRWLDSLIAAKVKPERPPAHIAVILGAVYRAHQETQQRTRNFIESLSRGQVPQRADQSLVELSVELIYDEVKYAFVVKRAGPNAFHVALQHQESAAWVRADTRPLSDGGLLIMCDSRSFITYAREEPAGFRLTIDGKTCVFPPEYDPTRLISRVSGRLVRYLVEDGEHVDQEQPFAELEVMKMYLTMQSPEAGVISLLKPAGSVVEAGEVMARLQLDDPSKVRRVVPFTGALPEMLPPQKPGRKPHQRYAHLRQGIESLLDGYDADLSCLDELLHLASTNSAVPAGELQEALAPLSGRIPASLQASLLNAITELRDGPGDNAELVRQAAHAMHLQIEDVCSSLAPAEKDAFDATLRPFTNVLERYERGGMRENYERLLASLLRKYIAVEKLFSRSKRADDVLFDMRELHRDDLSRVADIAISHAQVALKNRLVLALLERIAGDGPTLRSATVRQCLHELASFTSPLYSDIALRARLMLASSRRPALADMRSQLRRLLQRARETGSEELRQRMLAGVVESEESILDALVSVVMDGLEHIELRKLALRCQILRSYKAYNVYDLALDCDERYGFLRAQWRFQYRSASLGVGGLSGGGLGGGSGSSSSSNHSSNGGALALRSPIAAVANASAMRRSLRSYDSADNLHAWGFRVGMFAVFSSLDEMEERFDRVLEVFHAETGGEAGVQHEPPLAGGNSAPPPGGIGVNVLTVAVRWCSSSATDGTTSTPTAVAGEGGRASSPPVAAVNPSSGGHALGNHITATLTDFCRRSAQRKRAMIAAGIKMVTFLVAAAPQPVASTTTTTDGAYPAFYTFRASTDFAEDPIYRHIDPPMAFQLELNRLVNFRITRFEHPMRSIHVFYAEDRTDKGDARFFVRAFIRHADVYTSPTDHSIVSIPEAERTFVACLDALEAARCDRMFRRTDFNHLFLHLIPRVGIDVDDVEAICSRIFHRFSSRCWRLRVFMVEIKVHVERMGPRPLRFVLFNPTGHSLRVEGYVEQGDRLISLDSRDPGHLHGTPVDEPYQVLNRIQRRRVVAQTLETTYVYDYEELFTKALHEQWRRYAQERLLGGFRRHKIPLKLLTCVELVLRADDHGDADDAAPLLEVQRPPGENDIGMVAWRYTFYTPECPQGREAIVIANDITFMSGSFGPREDRLFAMASALARRLGVPRLYLAANSGARIGLAEELRNVFRVAWVDERDPTKGFRHLYLTAADKAKYEDELGVARTVDAGDGTFVLTDVFGAEHGLGVENLMGSGVIAAETSAAYEQCFTLTYVAARCVGIGAYVVRLGQRVIQRENNAPIILTGFSALNKLLGHEVYSSHEQLGGAKIMVPNGVTHAKVRNDYEGVAAILAWLAYVPRVHGERAPTVDSTDSVVREVEYDPRSESGDVRWALEGRTLAHAATAVVPGGEGGTEATAAAAAAAGASGAASNAPNSPLLSHSPPPPPPNSAFEQRLQERVAQLHAHGGADGRSPPHSPEALLSSSLEATSLLAQTGAASTSLSPLLTETGRRLDALPALSASGPTGTNMAAAAAAAAAAVNVSGGSTASAWLDGSLLSSTLLETSSNTTFQAGLFDRNSFRETLSGWAKTVVAGRARLGGIPIGVIAAQTMTVEKVVPPDPAAPDSREVREQQAGQVWYPDSSFKTAQCVRDFDREGLPLFVLANWRGFSGGARDMFQEVIKFGADIVDALRQYHNPVFVYVPPGGELRGGAWVVLDTAINPQHIEMYADESARGGVLEPAGTVDVKFRTRDLIKAMHRLRAVQVERVREVPAGSPPESERAPQRTGTETILSPENAPAPDTAAATIDAEAQQRREMELLSVFRQIAMRFADLHDTPGRMLHKHAIRRVVPWRTSRAFFYWRLRRRLAEDELRARVQAADPELGPHEVTALIRKWARAHDPALDGDTFENDDPRVVQWLEEEDENQIQRRLDKLIEARLERQMAQLGRECPAALMSAVERYVVGVEDEAARTEWVRQLHARIEAAAARILVEEQAGGRSRRTSSAAAVESDATTAAAAASGDGSGVPAEVPPGGIRVSARGLLSRILG